MKDSKVSDKFFEDLDDVRMEYDDFFEVVEKMEENECYEVIELEVG